MGMRLAYDGKRRALSSSLGGSPSAISTLYLGLLEASPNDYSDKSLDELLSVCPEFSINSNFYSGRKAITFGSFQTESPAILYVASNNSSDIVWSNTSGSSVTVSGYFITDAASGMSGEVLWLGTPDAGALSIPNGGQIKFVAGQLRLAIM